MMTSTTAALKATDLLSDNALQDPMSPAMRAECRAAIEAGSKSFNAASRLLPADVRWPAQAIYAFCRAADDAVDLSPDPASAFADLHRRLAHIYAGRSNGEPADRAFAEIACHYGIPQAIPLALLEGFRWDVEGRRYEELTDLLAYCVRVASTVGIMMSLVMGVRRPEVVARACELGMAMQLTNIARDVGEDARAGRVYLPLNWLRAAGIDPDQWLTDPRFSPALAAVVQRLLRVADELYERSVCGIAALPGRCRPAIHAARLIYAEIGRELERQGLDSVNRRAFTSTRRKTALLASACWHSLAVPASPARPPPIEAEFLIAAIPLVAPLHPIAAARRPWWDVSGAFPEMLELLLHLQQQRRSQELETI